MNQILDYDNNSTNYNNSSNNNNFNKGDGTDKIVRVFAILIMIFAIALIAVVVYGKLSNSDYSQKIEDNQNEANAKINVEIEGKQAVIEVTNDTKITKLIYSWNEGSERTITCDEKYIKETIDVPAGNNSLFIKVIDENGGETNYNEDITAEDGIDIMDPVIELSVTEEKKLKIVAKDETAIDFITVRWNDEDENTIYADENSKEISTEIEILKGENDLTVVAVDAASNTTRENKSFKGLTKPEIKVELVENGSKINIKAMHENGIKSVKFNFNNADYNVDIGDENPKQIEFEQQLETGYNRIIITVVSVDDTETVFDGECSYGDVSADTRREISSNNDGEEEVDSEEDGNQDDSNDEESEEED